MKINWNITFITLLRVILAVFSMPSNLPSSFKNPTQTRFVPNVQTSGAPTPLVQNTASAVPNSNLTLIVSIIALMLALASVYGTFFIEKPLSASQKAQLLGIANDLKSLQAREMTVSAPISTTILLNKSYPMKDLFPAQWGMPLEFSIPIDTEIIGVNSIGQPISFKIQESVPIKVTIPISSAAAFGANEIHIEKEMPVETKFTSTIKVRTAYGQDLNNLIDKLESLANGAS